MGCRDSLLVGCRTCDQWVVSVSPGSSCRRIFFSRVNFLCWLLAGDHSTLSYHIITVFLPKCRWQVTPKHAYTLDQMKSEWADYFAVQAWFGNLSRNKLPHNLYRNIRPQLSQLAELLWTDLGLKSGISVSKLISTSQKKCMWGTNCRTFSQNLARKEKATTTTNHSHGNKRSIRSRLPLPYQLPSLPNLLLWSPPVALQRQPHNQNKLNQ